MRKLKFFYVQGLAGDHSVCQFDCGHQVPDQFGRWSEAYGTEENTKTSIDANDRKYRGLTFATG